MLNNWIAEASRIARPQSRAVRINFRVLMAGRDPVTRLGESKYGGESRISVRRSGAPVRSQPAFAFIDNDGRVTVRLGALGEAGLIEAIDALLATWIPPRWRRDQYHRGW